MIAASLVWLAVLACVSAWALVPRRPSPRAPRPPARVLVVRPCAGTEPSLFACLASIPRGRFDARVAIAVESRSDAAWPIAEGAIAHLRAAGVDATLLATDARGPNRKIDQVARARAIASLDEDVVVVVDSDVDLGPFDFDALVAPFADARVAAAWAPPIEIAPTTLGDRASAAVLCGSLHAFAVLARLDPRGMVGKVMAIRTAHLRSVGGFEALVDRLGEDMELARRLHERGLRTVAVEPAASRACGRSVRDVVARYARWLAVIREQRPWLLASYPLLFAATPLVTVLALASREPEGVAVACVAVASRVAVAFVARRRSKAGASLGRAAFDAFAADAVLLAAFFAALGRRSVTWRGRTLRFGARGRLMESAR